MKKLSILFLFLCTFLTQVSAQESKEKTVFDYSETKHEFSLDIAPIIQGNYPSSLLYRNHYVSENGKNVALRLGAIINADFSSTTGTGSLNDLNRNNQGINLYVGKEWQKTFHPRIIGYYGVDFGAGFGRNEIRNTYQGNNTINSTSFNLNSTGFLGMRYHFSKHFSLSAETSVALNFNTGTNRIERPNFPTINENFNSVGLSMSPLRAIRFAFHF
ncbi:hypothetical protein [Aquiflexum gelatinilyticum]|uniref:hypothetical protein n=1 Tax=Aquiflexum gelatinilyticum TaxID=2961943 RepID=UPI00216A72D6|nr:hypothetical protein [Aquiflexum gelatinilyticum]MCS4433365.1 hypothetical protein [Aquiflexum gelatinilyticum]